MSRNHLLGGLGVSILLAVALAGCRGEPSPTPEVYRSPLASPIEMPAGVPEPTPTETPVGIQEPSPIERPTGVREPTPSKCPNGCINPTEGCLIKGVVTGMGERDYYLPGMEGYEDALLLVRYGGRWFCTKEEAIQNGFQKAPE